GCNVLEHDRARFRAVALPEFNAVNTIVGGEVGYPVHGHQLLRVGIRRIRVNVLDQERNSDGRQPPVFECFETQLALATALPQVTAAARTRANRPKSANLLEEGHWPILLVRVFCCPNSTPCATYVGDCPSV